MGKLLKLETLKTLPAKGYAYLFARKDKELSYVDSDGNETVLTSTVNGESDNLTDKVFTAFDFADTPDGALPATDLNGNPFFLFDSGGDNTPIIENGAVRTTAIGSGAAFYLGLKGTETVYEMGASFILGDGVMVLVLTQNEDELFENWNWPMHLKISQFKADFGIFVNSAEDVISKAGLNLSKTERITATVKFIHDTAYVYINGQFILSKQDSRFESMGRVMPIFEPFQNGSNILHTRLLSGYVKRTKQSGNEIIGVDKPRSLYTQNVLTGTRTLTGTNQGIFLDNLSCPQINTAIIIVKLPLNQTSAGDIILVAEGINIGTGQITTNETVISKAVKDDVITVPMQVNGIAGGTIRLRARGAFGTIPATTQGAVTMTVIPLSYHT